MQRCSRARTRRRRGARGKRGRGKRDKNKEQQAKQPKGRKRRESTSGGAATTGTTSSLRAHDWLYVQPQTCRRRRANARWLLPTLSPARRWRSSHTALPPWRSPERCVLCATPRTRHSAVCPTVSSAEQRSATVRQGTFPSTAQGSPHNSQRSGHCLQRASDPPRQREKKRKPKGCLLWKKKKKKSLPIFASTAFTAEFAELKKKKQ